MPALLAKGCISSTVGSRWICTLGATVAQEDNRVAFCCIPRLTRAISGPWSLPFPIMNANETVPAVGSLDGRSLVETSLAGKELPLLTLGPVGYLLCRRSATSLTRRVRQRDRCQGAALHEECADDGGDDWFPLFHFLLQTRLSSLQPRGSFVERLVF